MTSQSASGEKISSNALIGVVLILVNAGKRARRETLLHPPHLTFTSKLTDSMRLLKKEISRSGEFFFELADFFV